MFLKNSIIVLVGRPEKKLDKHKLNGRKIKKHSNETPSGLMYDRSQPDYKTNSSMWFIEFYMLRIYNYKLFVEMSNAWKAIKPNFCDTYIIASSLLSLNAVQVWLISMLF